MVEWAFLARVDDDNLSKGGRRPVTTFSDRNEGMGEPQSASEPAIRLAHFSDIHVTARPLGWRWRDLFTKRATGWMNLRLGRGRRFHDAEAIVAAMMRVIRERGIDHVVFSGDATTLGFEAEFATAARLLDVAAVPGLAVPGNHDYYTRLPIRAGYFERTFASWQQGERIGDATYPFAQRVGHCWLVGVNSACSNRLVWDARGRVGTEQAARLRQLLGRLEPGPRILVTHYPLYLADGRPERRWRRLRDWESFRDIVDEGGIDLWLHGHRHGSYVRSRGERQPFTIICAGSATQMGNCSWNEYAISGRQMSMVRWTWNTERVCFEPLESRSFGLIFHTSRRDELTARRQN
jgi:3',5'-cyclic AMP phosphodiesterase CpdA